MSKHEELAAYIAEAKAHYAKLNQRIQSLDIAIIRAVKNYLGKADALEPDPPKEVAGVWEGGMVLSIGGDSFFFFLTFTPKAKGINVTISTRERTPHNVLVGHEKDVDKIENVLIEFGQYIEKAIKDEVERRYMPINDHDFKKLQNINL